MAERFVSRTILLCSLIAAVLYVAAIVSAWRTSAGQITGFSLVDGFTGEAVAAYDPIGNGSLVIADAVPAKNGTIRVSHSAESIDRVDFSVNDTIFYTDDTSPFEIDLGSAKIVQGGVWRAGEYVVSAVGYGSGHRLRGRAMKIRFTVVENEPAVDGSSADLAAEATTRTLPIIPGARGHGITTFAGSGRHVHPPLSTIFRVSTLADSGPGSLRKCIEASVPRVCVFEISGRIALKDRLKISHPYITVAGQTAPSPGIMLSGAGVYIRSHDVLLQHLQIRPGDGAGDNQPGDRDGLSIGMHDRDVFNVVVDHVSVSWATDENVGLWFTGTRDVTIRYSIIAESLVNSIHPKGRHGMGILVGDEIRGVTISHSLLAMNENRNPRIKHGTDVEFLNNVVYGWGNRSRRFAVDLTDDSDNDTPLLLNFAGNYYKRAPYTPDDRIIYARSIAPNTRVYVGDNISRLKDGSVRRDWDIAEIEESPHRAVRPVARTSGIPELRPEASYRHVLRNAGARRRETNPVDSRIISNVRRGTGTLKDCVVDCVRTIGGWPNVLSSRHQLDLPVAPHQDDDGDGYTNLENFLQELARSSEIEEKSAR